MTSSYRLTGLAFVLGLAACSSSPSSSAGGAGQAGAGSGGTFGSGGGAGQNSAGMAGTIAADAGEDAASDADVGIGPYPPGPYGADVGAVLPDLEGRGYLRHDATGLASSASFATLRFSDIRASAPVGHAVIHLSGFT